MIILKLSLRTILRRKKRMLTIGLLVLLGTILLVLGQTFVNSTAYYSKESVIQNFTGDFIIYSRESKEKPSPFAFTTPLPNIKDIEQVFSFLEKQPVVATYVPIAQNYSLISVERRGKTVEIPFIYYAIDPVSYRDAFKNIVTVEGSYFGLEQNSRDYKPGILISKAQFLRYEDYYDVSLEIGEEVSLLGLTQGGSVNAVNTRLTGIFESIKFKNIFDYINFMDISTYSELYNFTGVKSGSLPASFEKIFNSDSEEDIFASAFDEELAAIDLDTLEQEALSGYSMIAVKLNDRSIQQELQTKIENSLPTVLTIPWDQASGFFAPIAGILQSVIYVIVAIIFLIVTFIFMNTLIINIIERTDEIGTIRAMGGEKRFIRALFISETLMLNSVFAVAGIIISAVLILLFGEQGIPLPDIMSQYLIGGGNLPLNFSIFPFIQALIIVILVSVLATLYPTQVATKITPLKAMSSN